MSLSQPQTHSAIFTVMYIFLEIFFGNKLPSYLSVTDEFPFESCVFLATGNQSLRSFFGNVGLIFTDRVRGDHISSQIPWGFTEQRGKSDVAAQSHTITQPLPCTPSKSSRELTALFHVGFPYQQSQLSWGSHSQIHLPTDLAHPPTPNMLLSAALSGTRGITAVGRECCMLSRAVAEEDLLATLTSNQQGSMNYYTQRIIIVSTLRGGQYGQCNSKAVCTHRTQVERMKYRPTIKSLWFLLLSVY